jgi:hypothetical protein
MSTQPHDAFPDLHQKMSKKIAQLTKVIYHLNTRNEDHQSELDAIAHSHQLETQQLARDAANKIGKFKDLVDVRKVAVRFKFDLYCPFFWRRFPQVASLFLGGTGASDGEVT